MRSLLLGMLILLTSQSAFAQSPIVTQRVKFAPGMSQATIKGSIKGYMTRDYLVGARAGQQMKVVMTTSNRFAYFNVLPVDGETALFVGNESGARFNGTLPASGDYRVRVYLMRNAARRNEIAPYTLDVSLDKAAAK